jgi:hypothetical protein
MGTIISDINHAANAINPLKGAVDWQTNHSLNYIPGIGKPLAQAANWGDSHPAQVGAAIGAAFGGEALLAGDAADAGGAAATLPADVSVGTTGAGGATATAGGLGAAGTTGLTTAQEIQLGLSAASLAKSAMTPTPSVGTVAPATQVPNGPESQGGSAAQAMMAGSGQAGGASGVAQTLLTGTGGIDPSMLGLGKNILLGS